MTTGFHEDLSPRARGKSSSDRTFGFVFAVFLSVVGVWPLVAGRPLRGWAIVAAGAFALVALVQPTLLRPLNRGWTWFGRALHTITSPVMVGIIYFGAVVPAGLVMRAFGRDLLGRSRDASASSYWVHRVPPGPPPESMHQQF